MKDVTTDFTDAQVLPNVRKARLVSYKRRSWDSGTSKYIWETNWTDLTENQIVSVSPIAWSFDTQELSEFKVSNVNIRLRNLDNEWTPGNADGNFDGFEPYWTKWRIQSGLILGDGSVEKVTLFTGLTVDVVPDFETGDATFAVHGLESLLLNGNAEDYGTTVTDEDAGTGNDVLVDFYTDQPGIGIMKTVKLGTTVQIEGVDYAVSQLDDPDAVAKITFTNPVPNGVHVYVTYIWWPQDVAGDDVVKDLLTLGGIPPGDQNVSTIEFSQSVFNTHTDTTQSDWEGGTLTAIDTATLAGSIGFKFSEAKTWNNSLDGWSSDLDGAAYSSTGTGLYFVNTGIGSEATAYRSHTNMVGDWSIVFKEPSGNSGKNVLAWLGLTGNSLYNPPSGTIKIADGLEFFIYLGDSVHYWSLGWTDSSGNRSSFCGANFSARPTLNTDHTIRVRRRPGNHFQVYFDGSLVGSAQSDWLAQTSSTYFGYHINVVSGTALYLRYDGVSVPVSNDGVGVWVSPAFDSTVTPSAWASCLYSYTQAGSDTVEVQTESSADNATYDSSVALSGNEVQSTFRRYLKVKFIFTLAHESAGDTTVQSVTFGSTTSSTLILMPVMTGKNIYDAISAMAQFANYEFGFYPDETFFFRPRVFDGVAAMTLAASDILAITSFSGGWGRVASSVKATYGLYTKYVEDAGTTSTGPRSRFAFLRHEITADSAYQISATADVATGVATQFYAMLSKPRKRFKARAKLLPQLDLGDIVQVDYREDLDMKCRIVGTRYDLEEWTTELDLEEVVPIT